MIVLIITIPLGSRCIVYLSFLDSVRARQSRPLPQLNAAFVGKATSARDAGSSHGPAGADLLLQTPSRVLKCIVDRKINVGVALVGVRLGGDIFTPFIRQARRMWTSKRPPLR